MVPPSVDYDRVASEYDLRYEENQYPGIVRLLKEFAHPSHAAPEVGCGTGYWLARLRAYGSKAIGLDRSSGMLHRAPNDAGRALLVQSRAAARTAEAQGRDLKLHADLRIYATFGAAPN